MSTKAKSKKAAKRGAPMNGETKVTLAKGQDPKTKRGLMGKMAAALAGKSITRDELAKRFKSAGRVKVMKNVQWGVKHGVFATAK